MRPRTVIDRHRRWLAATALLLCTGVVRADAPPPRDAFLAELAGRWTFTGDVRGQPVRYRVEGSWVLGGGWLRLALVDQGRPPGYRADVYLGFDPKAGDYVAHWLDRFGAAGARVVGTGHREGRTLVLRFPYADAPFRDTLTLAPDGRSGRLLLEAQEADGRWTHFASYAMTRRR